MTKDTENFLFLETSLYREESGFFDCNFQGIHSRLSPAKSLGNLCRDSLVELRGEFETPLEFSRDSPRTTQGFPRDSPGS